MAKYGVSDQAKVAKAKAAAAAAPKSPSNYGATDRIKLQNMGLTNNVQSPKKPKRETGR